MTSKVICTVTEFCVRSRLQVARTRDSPEAVIQETPDGEDMAATEVSKMGLYKSSFIYYVLLYR
jgi:hypothetical protein